jgi:hypothetical protein
MRKFLNSTTALVTLGLVFASGVVHGQSLEFFNTVDDSGSNSFGFGYLESESGYQSFFQDGALSAFESTHTGTAAVGTGSSSSTGLYTGYVDTTFASGVSRDDLSTFRTSATEELDGNGFTISEMDAEGNVTETSYGGGNDPDFDTVVSTGVSRASASTADEKNFIYWVDTLDFVGGLSQSTRDTMASGTVGVSIIKDNVFTSGNGIVVAFRNLDGSLIAIDANGNQVTDASESDIISDWTRCLQPAAWRHGSWAFHRQGFHRPAFRDCLDRVGAWQRDQRNPDIAVGTRRADRRRNPDARRVADHRNAPGYGGAGDVEAPPPLQMSTTRRSRRSV